ncbi:Suppressor of the cold-sensitive snRNP biogenesis mutant brr1-1 [Quaeritorhiza haematococci]|nr:Suppressor of the cold-sensitive snRNP biogenesis mutant brr1-1 [Quaeritorhiza haematococci]
MGRDQSLRARRSGALLLRLAILGALLASLFPWTVPAAPTVATEDERLDELTVEDVADLDGVDDVGLKSTPIPNHFLVLFTQAPPTTTASDVKAAEREFLHRVLGIDAKPNEANHGNNGLGNGSSQGEIIEAMVVEKQVMWHVKGPEDLPAKINANGTIAIVEPNMVVEVKGGRKMKDVFRFRPPGDWGLKKIAQNQKKYIYPSHGGRNVDVYILDSGIDVNHPDFEGRALNGVSFINNGDFTDELGHGTHIAGIIGSKHRGVAPNTTLISVRVFGKGPGTTVDTVIRGLIWIIQRVRSTKRKSIVNLSFGFDGASRALGAMIQIALRAGIYVVAAAGNEGVDACDVVPANIDGVITVGAINAKGRTPKWSNHGACVDILAPGVDVQSTWPRHLTRTKGSSARAAVGHVAWRTGTSYSAPFVAGVLALILAERKFNSVADGRDYLLKIAANGVVPNVANLTPNLVVYNGHARLCDDNPCFGLVE